MGFEQALEHVAGAAEGGDLLEQDGALPAPAGTASPSGAGLGAVGAKGQDPKDEDLEGTDLGRERRRVGCRLQGLLLSGGEQSVVHGFLLGGGIGDGG